MSDFAWFCIMLMVMALAAGAPEMISAWRKGSQSDTKDDGSVPWCKRCKCRHHPKAPHIGEEG